ncbi:hypothetical protein AAK913_12610 [Enterococcus faecium]|uniref:hypothetical protein n=1 Tax=Enterococcus faecium TaxID=1352 RepID=UPI00351833F5
METTRRSKRDEIKPLLIHFGKDTKATFTEEGKLLQIRLKVNKYGELVGNEVVTQESIFEREYIGVISRLNAKTYVKIDQEKTKNYEENQAPYKNDGFVFFIDQENTARKNEIYNLYSKKRK